MFPMTATKPVKLNIKGLNESASKMVIAICNERGCTIEQAIVLITNQIAKSKIN